MKKFFFLIALIISASACKAQLNPVRVASPYVFNQFVHVKGSLYADSAIAANDNSNKAATTAWVKGYVTSVTGNYLPLSGGTMTGNLFFSSGASLQVNSDIANMGVKSTTNTNLYTASTYNSFEIHNGANNYTSFNKGQINVTDASGNAFYIQYPATLLSGSTTVTFRNIGGTIALLSDMSGFLTNPMTTAGDLIIGGTGGTPVRLAQGATGTLLTVTGSGSYGWSLPNNFWGTSVATGGVLEIAAADGLYTAADANFTNFNTPSTWYTLPTITANRTITLPSSPFNGLRFKFNNQNTSGSFSWSFASTVKNPNGSTVTTFPNGYIYEVEYDGSTWWLVNSYTNVIAGNYLPLSGGTMTGSIITSGTVTASGGLSSFNGTYGLSIGANTAGNGYGAIYSNGVTPSNTNYSFASNGGNTFLNASSEIFITVGGTTIGDFKPTGIVVTGALSVSSLTASKVVFSDASKNLTSTGIGTSSQFIKGDGSLDANSYQTALTFAGGGVTLSGSNVQLGGTLTQNVIIGASTFYAQIGALKTTNTEIFSNYILSTSSAGYLASNVSGISTVTGSYLNSIPGTGFEIRGNKGMILPRLDNGTLGSLYLNIGVNSIDVTNGGSGYTSPPTVVFTGGSPTTAATAVATVQSGAVVRVDIITPGSGYTSLPSISFTGGGGSGATATASSIPTGALMYNLTNDRVQIYSNPAAAWRSVAYTSDLTTYAPIATPVFTGAAGIGIQGTTSGTTQIVVQPTTGNYNFNLPIAAGTSGYVLTSGGGGSAAMTWTNLANYAFGSPTATTQPALTNNTTIATTAYTDAAVAATATYFATGLFSGSGASGSPYDLNVNHITGNPTGTIGLTAVNGTATTVLRSDATPALSQAIAPTWTASHIFQNSTITTTVTPWVYVANNTVATSGTSQLLSPAVSLRSHYWTGTADATSDMLFWNEADSFGSYLTFGYSSAGGAATKVFSVSQYGDMSAFGTSSAGSIQISKTTMATTSSDGVILTSSANTASAGTPVRYSPDILFRGMVWNTSGTPASNVMDFKVENRPVSSAAPTGSLFWSSRESVSGSGAYTDIASLSSIGTFGSVHLAGISAAPTIAAGTGAGTSPTVSVSGNDEAGIVNITTGTSPAASNAIVATITYNTAYASAPKGVVLTPANTNAVALASTTQVFVPANGQTNGTTTTTFVVEGNGTALAASTAYIWTYHVIQ